MKNKSNIIVGTLLLGIIMIGCGNNEETMIKDSKFKENTEKSNLSFDQKEKELAKIKDINKTLKDNNTSIEDNNTSIEDNNITVKKPVIKKDSMIFNKKDIDNITDKIASESKEWGNNFSEKASEYSKTAMDVTKSAAGTAYEATKEGLYNGATWSKDYAKNWFAETWEDSKRDYAEKKEARKKAREESAIKKN